MKPPIYKYGAKYMYIKYRIAPILGFQKMKNKILNANIDRIIGIIPI